MSSTPSSRELAELLSRLLQEVVPDGIVVTAAYAVLSHVQDAVAGSTTEPWPGTGTVLPLPEAEIRDGRLLAWFGDREAPVLVIVGEANAWPVA